MMKKCVKNKELKPLETWFSIAHTHHTYTHTTNLNLHPRQVLWIHPRTLLVITSHFLQYECAETSQKQTQNRTDTHNRRCVLHMTIIYKTKLSAQGSACICTKPTQLLPLYKRYYNRIWFGCVHVCARGRDIRGVPCHFLVHSIRTYTTLMNMATRSLTHRT